MKKFASILFVALALALFVFPAVQVGAASSQAPTYAPHLQDANPPVAPAELPLELQALVAAGIGFLVTAGLKSLSVLLNKDISGWGSVITGGLVTSAVYFLNAILSAVPVSAQPSVAIGLTLIVSILGAFGVAATVKKFQPVKAPF
jgi:hypothetical protein